MEPVLGIDFGTSYIRCSIWEDDTARAVTFTDGDSKMAAYITIDYDEGGKNVYVVGQEGRELSTLHPERSKFDFVRFLGVVDKETRKDTNIALLDTFPFHFSKSLNPVYSFFRSRLADDTSLELRLEPALIIILKEVKRQAEIYAKQPLLVCGLALPHKWFNSVDYDLVRRIVQSAATGVGFESTLLMRDSEAIMCGCTMRTAGLPLDGSVSHVLLVDVGATASRVMIFKQKWRGNTRFAENNPKQTFEGPGGNHVDGMLMQHCVQHFYTKHGLDLHDDFRAVHQLRVECERAKRKLSTARFFDFNMKNLSGNKDLQFRLELSSFEDMCGPFAMTIVRLIDQALAQCGKSPVYRILLVGGGSRIRLVRQLIDWANPGSLDDSIAGSAEEVCAIGTACLAASPIEQSAAGNSFFNRFRV